MQLAADAEEAAKRAQEAAVKKNELWAEARKVGDEADAEAKAKLHQLQQQGQAHVQAKEE